MLESFIVIVFCHLLGDYVLQSNFIATTKGSNWYHLFIHCVLYILPFYICFGLDYRLYVLFASHLIIDPLKTMYNKITYADDQLLHYLIALILYW